MLDKKALRREIGQKKRAMTTELIETYSRDLAEKLYETPEYKEAKSIYAYLPYNQEVRTWQICERAKADGKRIAVPKVYGDIMRFLWFDDFTQVAPGGWDIPEPTYDEPEADDEHAMVLMPGLAFDPEGHRVGYGGGFYDKYLEQHKQHKLVALCYPFQMFEHLEVEEHDIPVDRVVVADALELKLPTAAYAEQIRAFRAEFLAAGDSLDGAGSLRRMEDPAEWLEQVRQLSDPETVSGNWVQSTQFICVRKADDHLVGMIQVRHRFNEFLEKIAGHIGYSVRPSERRKGYATWMLDAAKPFCRKIGLERILVSCDESNEASRRTILANGGVYESTVHDGDVAVQRYWIAL